MIKPLNQRNAKNLVLKHFSRETCFKFRSPLFTRYEVLLNTETIFCADILIASIPVHFLCQLRGFWIVCIFFPHRKLWFKKVQTLLFSQTRTCVKQNKRLEFSSFPMFTTVKNSAQTTNPKNLQSWNTIVCLVFAGNSVYFYGKAQAIEKLATSNCYHRNMLFSKAWFYSA